MERGGPLRFLTLTSSPQAAAPIQRDLRRLFARLRRRQLLSGYIRVIETTKSGADHAHIIFRGPYIAQAYLSALWDSLHQSPVIDIRALKSGPHGKRGAAAYLAKYMSKEGSRRYSWSSDWVYRGFVRTWLECLRIIRNELSSRDLERAFPRWLTIWAAHLRGRSPPFVLVDFIRQNTYALAATAPTFGGYR